jgi:hypothetical protein
MTNKKNVVKDLLCVIAYGTSGARSSAAKLLFYYWPTFNPNLFDRRVVLQKFTSKYCQALCNVFPLLGCKKHGRQKGRKGNNIWLLKCHLIAMFNSFKLLGWFSKGKTEFLYIACFQN